MGFCFLATACVSHASDDAADIPSGSVIRVSGDVVHKWRENRTDLIWIRGQARLQHQERGYQADEIVLTVDGVGTDLKVGVLMSRVRIGDDETADKPLLARIACDQVPVIDAPVLRGATELPDDWRQKLRLPPVQSDVTNSDASASGNAFGIAPVQYTQPMLSSDVPSAPSRSSFDAPISDLPSELPAPAPLIPAATESASTETLSTKFFVGGGTRSIEFLPRGTSLPPRLETVDRGVAGESIIVLRGGATILVRDVSVQSPDGVTTSLGTVSLSANRIVAWVPTLRDIFTGGRSISEAEGELYLEGDIVLRQGDSVVYADAMYYNATREVGVILDAETVATVPEYQGVVRIKARALRQVARGNYLASNAAVTSSRMGVPRYWLQSEQLQVTPRPVAVLDPATGNIVADTEPYLTSGGNAVYLGGYPVFFWPRFQTSLRRPTFYLTGARLENDDIFGTQVLLEWDLFQLLGFVNPPAGVEAILLTDYLSERGPAIGTRTTYNRASLFGIAGPVVGTYDSYLIDDDGLDFLGFGRQGLTPEESLRGRTTLRHRHYLPNQWEFIAEVGYLSDRNFLEQFFEQEWEGDVDRTTGFRLRKYAGSQLLDLSANVQINDFYRETERLPSLNHYALGGTPLGDLVTWSMHNEVGYERLNVADDPLDPVIAASTADLPGELQREGIVTRTRQELSLPFDLGPLRLIPFAIGEAAHYGQDTDGEDLTRLWGGGGVRANLPLTRIDPTIQSSLLNIRGLAHKVDLSAEFFYADSDTDLEDLPYYDPLDDNAQEEFRRVFTFTNFGGGPIPDPFDPRFVAFRNGIQRYVASPSDTIVDDLQQVRLGMTHRLQTKRGLPGRERMVDLFRFNAETILFTDEDRDNFG
ncbi:MAG: organic solvent tolerance protein OstA, partial [Planctomycetota bacterium]